MTHSIRVAKAEDYPATVLIEAAADALLVDLFDARHWPGPSTAEERAAAPGFVLIAEDQQIPTPVGFVHVLEIAGHAHLEQLSVLPSHSRRGLGRLLVDAALDEASRRGYALITLRTYADVPWNAPFYRTCGFVPSEPDSDFLRSLVGVEEALGLTQYGPRLQMAAALPRWRDSAPSRQ
ncbi:Acetyltransferase (GNAT) family protein [Microbacterium hydrocarbonoxydans]|jgi:GNAT superfamily N-acetyltransferase|uniref:Acetyltransferase (GNAT) family protein n=1 Tax=Microbacterium hydrocarbonoxydans TaxID=273678 RepID=A0A0M2HM59_9MICO|nr:GNAT family N-acetyltransferase [Microbacterium hydrocarbonoxydans]KJL46018.1 Acetyltransferase (GNAT) family protein [Microbacterium hydrocarbonoxydans]